MFSLIPLPYRIAAIAVIVAMASMWAYFTGKSSGIESAEARLQPQINQMHVAIDAADALSKIQITKQEEVKNEITSQNADAVARIHAYYQRMLHAASAGSQAGASAVAASSEGIDVPTCQSALAGSGVVAVPDLGFEQACTLDASTVTQWQAWARSNNFPVK